MILAEASRLLVHDVEELNHLGIGMCRLGRELRIREAPRHVRRRVADGGEGVSQLVPDARRELPHGRELLGSRARFLRVAKLGQRARQLFGFRPVAVRQRLDLGPTLGDVAEPR